MKMKKAWLWICNIMMGIMGIGAMLGVIVGTMMDKPYDESNYLKGFKE